ncbi:MAG: peroxide stress protein YaaA [Aquificota bacterium]|nr:MAG: peroxide stress protein YaaA [Aquificota bacterium]
MLLFILPYSKRQSRLKVKDCGENRFAFPEVEPLAVKVEESFLKGEKHLLPAWKRFKSVFWESLEFWVLPPPVAQFIDEHSLVFSPVYGLLKPSSCIPYLPVDWKESYEGKSLFAFWKEHLKALSPKLLEGKTLFLFAGARERSLLDLKEAERLVSFEYYRKDQKVKNPAKHWAYTLRYIAEKGIDMDSLHRINFYDYKVEDIQEKGKRFLVRMRSEGRYV